MDNNMILSPPATSTRQLYWDGQERTYTGEMSDTNGFGRVYADACDEGMTLFNPQTGRSVTVVVDYVAYDSGELQYWKLIPTPNHTCEFKVIIFND